MKGASLGRALLLRLGSKYFQGTITRLRVIFGASWSVSNKRSFITSTPVRHLQGVRNRHASQDQERRWHEAVVVQRGAAPRRNRHRTREVVERLKKIILIVLKRNITWILSLISCSNCSKMICNYTAYCERSPSETRARFIQVYSMIPSTKYSIFISIAEN